MLTLGNAYDDKMEYLEMNDVRRSNEIKKEDDGEGEWVGRKDERGIEGGMH